MPSDLLNSPLGILSLYRATHDQIERRLRRWFKSNTVVAFDDWVAGGKTIFDFYTVLGNLNEAHDPEVMNLLDLISQLESYTITEDLNIYVDTNNGSDLTGDGSIDSPIASFRTAQRICPRYINSKINIFVSTKDGMITTPVSDVENWFLKFGKAGQLTIQGIDSDDIFSGPHTVNVWNNIGISDTYGHSIQVAAPIWANGALVGKFVHVLSGAQTGYYFAIGENTTDTIYIAKSSVVMAPADTFEIVEPGTKFSISPAPNFNSVCINLMDRRNYVDSNTTKFGIFGIKFNSPSILEIGSNNAKCLFGYVNFDELQIIGDYLEVNHESMFDTTQVIRDKTALNNHSGYYINSLQLKIYQIGLYHLSCKNILSYSFITWVLNSGFQKYTQIAGVSLIKDNFIFSGSANNAFDQGASYHPGALTINGIWINPNNLTSTISWKFGGFIKTTDFEGNVATQYTAILGPGCTMSFDGTPISGTINDVQWQTTGAAAAFPGVAGTSISDGNGAFCVKLS